MTDVSVKPLRTFWHGELKTKRSPDFEVEKGVSHELETLGLVGIVGEVEVAVVPDDEPEPVNEDEVVPADVPPKKKGRPNAVDKDS